MIRIPRINHNDFNFNGIKIIHINVIPLQNSSEYLNHPVSIRRQKEVQSYSEVNNVLFIN